MCVPPFRDVLWPGWLPTSDEVPSAARREFVAVGGIADFEAESLLELLVLRGYRGKVTLDSGQASIRLVERLRREQVRNLSAVGQILLPAQVVPELVEAVACVGCVDCERSARDHELAAVDDILVLIAEEVSLIVDHSRSHERRDSLSAGGAVHLCGRRLVDRVELLEVGHRERSCQELCPAGEVFVPKREPVALAVDGRGLQAVGIPIEPVGPFGGDGLELRRCGIRRYCHVFVC